MKVSIMITTYNSEQYVDKAIKSVIQQNMPFSWELLVGDDGSSDSTQERIDLWIKKYPNNIRMYIMPRDPQETKNGTRSARNRANLLTHATGEYLIFLDGDDEFTECDKIRRQVSILDNKKYQDCSCVAHNITAFNFASQQKELLTEATFPEGVVDTKYYWENLYFHTNTILFRACCKEMMLNDKYRDFLNDNFITYIILQYGKIYYINQSWAQYNLTGDGLWTGKNRTYGCFRNLIIYDLEITINKRWRYSCFVRHLYDFRYIFKHYNREDRKRVDLLLENLNPELFHYTFLMYKFKDELNSLERGAKLKLLIDVNLTTMARRGKKVIHTIKTSINGRV